MQIRAVCSAYSLGFGRLLAALVYYAFYPLLHVAGVYALLLFIVFRPICIILLHKYMPETRNRPIHHIIAEIAGKCDNDDYIQLQKSENQAVNGEEGAFW